VGDPILLAPRAVSEFVYFFIVRSVDWCFAVCYSFVLMVAWLIPDRWPLVACTLVTETTGGRCEYQVLVPLGYCECQL
jgi:hypothetical protein